MPASLDDVATTLLHLGHPCTACATGEHEFGRAVEERFADLGLTLRRRRCVCRGCLRCSGALVRVVPHESWRGQHRQ
ncbi:hypothetical protein [Gandjariella thermophila]|uniref:Uncharacterized protein n=1 Tax=Gandjariella thermophila TaxID=1931992 RepID=A0A4D4JFH9_9PSEU|nr:hypothetical protein [Gandjariella thermophila]GDY32633.1 hypothetical protein GTS_42660 [Gandjariella thermophila]